MEWGHVELLLMENTVVTRVLLIIFTTNHTFNAIILSIFLKFY